VLIALTFSARLFAQTPFTGTMKLSGVYGEADGNPVYDLLPITVECRAKLDRKTGYNILIANGLKMSDRHWEIFSAPNSGFFSAYLPGCKPAEIQSKTDIVDGRWHYLAMTFDAVTVKLYVDGVEVASQKTQPNKSYADVSSLTFGYYPGIPPAGDVEIDEVRISRVLRPINGVPAEPFKLDVDTMGLCTSMKRVPIRALPISRSRTTPSA